MPIFYIFFSLSVEDGASKNQTRRNSYFWTSKFEAPLVLAVADVVLQTQLYVGTVDKKNTKSTTGACTRPDSASIVAAGEG